MRTLILSFLLLGGLTAASAPVSRLCGDVSKNVGATSLHDDVRAYYLQIDRADVDTALARFAPHARYVRGSEVLEGIASIREFYLKKRTLEGAHNVTLVKVTDNRVYVEGTFDGTSGGVKVKINFTDTWVYDLVTGEVVERVSVLTNDRGEPLAL